MGSVLEAFDLGFRAVGRGLVRVGRFFWKAWTWVLVGVVCLQLLLLLVAHPAVMSVAGNVALVCSALLLGRARKITKTAEAASLQAQLNSTNARDIVSTQVKARQDMERKLGTTETALRSATIALAVIDGAALPLDRDAIVSAIQIAVSRLVAVVEGMDDQRRAQSLLDVCEHLRTLCGEIEDDEMTAAAVNTKVAAINDQITGHVDRTIDQAIAKLAEAGIPDAAVFPGKWTP